MSTAKGAAEVIAALMAQVGLDLPVRLRAWDGSGDLDVEGDLTDGLRRVHATAPGPGARSPPRWPARPP